MKSHFLAGLLLLCLLLGCQRKKEKPLLTIAVAANLQYVIKSITNDFTDQTGIPCETIIGSSGKLAAQIQAGAPFHVFLSADMYYPNYLYQEGFASSKPQVYAQGQLVLWTMHRGIKPELASLTNEKIEKIAIANPKLAPYGKAAIEAMKKLHVYEQAQNKLVIGESIAQVNQFISTEAATLGFTAKSTVMAPTLRQQGNWVEIDTENYTAIEQGMIALKQDDPKASDHAKAFKNFLLSNRAASILNKFGYLAKHE